MMDDVLSPDARQPYRIWVPTVRAPFLNWLMCKPVKRVPGFLDARREALQAREFLGAPEVRHDLYVHVPVCVGKCAFCAVPTREFNDVRQLLPGYCGALLRELDMYAAFPAVRNSAYGVVYFGGGTPSVLNAEDLYQLIRRLLTGFS